MNKPNQIPQSTIQVDSEIKQLKANLKKDLNKLTKQAAPIKYPSNAAITSFIDAVTDQKINATMSEVCKTAAKSIAGYLDFITGYWPDYEKHIRATVVTAEDLREASRDSDKGGKEWDYWPKEIQNKLVKHAQNEHKQRVRTVEEMGAFLRRQQETMEKFSPEAAAAMEAIQDNLAA